MRGTSLDRLTLLATHALSSAIFGFALTQYPGIEPLVGALAGAVVFLCLRHIYDTLSLARDRREIAEDLNFIRAANLSVRGSLDDTRRKVTEITSALAKRAELHERKIAAELEQIEEMLNQLPVSAPAKSNVPAAPVHARTLGDPAMLELIRRSLEENRVDLYLQPIVNLPQRKVRFYEALTRLRSADGSVVMPSQYIKVAAPAGLMSVVDNLMLFRCIQLVRRLSQKKPRHRGLLQHLRAHAEGRGILSAVPRIPAQQPRPVESDRVRVRARHRASGGQGGRRGLEDAA